MSDLLAARSQMAMSLAFHIVFAVAGIAMPLFLAIAEWRWLRGGDPVDRELTRRWARGTAILFAVGAVSGTVLSFELGLLWPAFMRHAGAIIGMPFSLEGFAFFLEAIFLGLYLYGGRRLPPLAHWLAAVMVAVSGAASAVFVVCANAWMNTPAGFRSVNGRVVGVDPVAAMFNPAAGSEVLHMIVAAYLTIGFAVAAIHAFMLLRDPGNAFHRRALAITFPVAAACAVLQPLTGDVIARQVAARQPVKLAALEGQWRTQANAPLRLGGLPDARAQETRGALEIPSGLSLLAYHDPAAVVRGLDQVPPADRPPVAIVHVSFQLMVLSGTVMALVAVIGAVLAWRRRGVPDRPWFLRLLVLCGPLGFVALETGWTVTEVGRQPWIIQGVMRTRDAVTPMPGLVVPFVTFTALYLVLAVVVGELLRRQVFASPRMRAVHAGARRAG